MTSDLTWLHLSDLHARQDTGWDARRVLKSLREDLERLAERDSLRPELIFFTGDAAFGHLSGAPIAEQFDIAFSFFEELRKLFDIERGNVFLVPGNHDVDRQAVLGQSNDWLDARIEAYDLEGVQRLYQRGGKELEVILDRLAAYRAALERHSYHHLLHDPERLFYVERRSLHGVEIAIAGLDSAWSCGRDGERGRLWMAGDWQIGQIEPTLDEAQLRIGLVHHPLGWLCEPEAASLEPLLARTFDFFLHGHEHRTWVETINGHMVRIAAGACYESSDRENGYNLVRLDFESSKGEIWLRQYERSGGGWVSRNIHGHADTGIWPIADLPFFDRSDSPGSGLGLSEPVVRELVEEVFDALAANPIVLLLAQDCHEPRQVISTLEARARESRRVLHLVPPPGDLTEAELFADLGRQVGLDENTPTSSEWEMAFEKRLDQESYFVLISGFSRAHEYVRKALGGILRALAERKGDALWVVLIGGDQLAELKYELGQDSVLSSAADEIEWPEITPQDLLSRAAEMQVPLTNEEAAELAEATGRDCRVLREVFRAWRRDRSEPLDQIFHRSSVLTAIFSPFRGHTGDRERIAQWLISGEIGPYRPWPADPLLRRLFWAGALRVRRGCFRWRSMALVWVGREVLECGD